MTDKGHRRLEYALILVGIVLVGAFCAWAADGVSGNWRVGGDLIVSQDVSIGRDLTITDDLAVTDDCVFSDAVAISGEVTLADSTYSAEDLTFAADQTIRVTYLGLMEITGSKGDTTHLQPNTIFVRNDSVLMVPEDKGAVVTIYGY